MFCIYCGGDNPQDSVFCRSCGRRITAVQQTSNQVAPQSDFPSYQPSPLLYQAASTENAASMPGTFAAQPAVSQSQPFPVAARPQNSQLKVTLGIVGVVLFIALAWGGYAYANRSTPTRTLENTCNALTSGDYATAYNQFSTSSSIQRSSGSQATLAAYLKRYVASQGGITSCTVDKMDEAATPATGWIHITYGNGRVENDHFKLVDENGVWKIDGAATN